MSRVLHYECFSGISGDMHLGALIDLGVPVELLRSELAKLDVADEFELIAERGQKLGISGTRATVRIKPGIDKPHRHLADIHAMIDRAGYAPSVAERAKRAFTILGQAEARIHDTDIESIHFHEVGATDAIVDILGAAIGIDHLGIEQAYCGPIELGGGMVRCEHGLLPVPAPATAEILKGTVTTRGRVDGEATTPTGAAILKTFVDAFEPPANLRIENLGYGIGQKDFAVPNALRLSIGTCEAAAGERPLTETNLLIECNIDDMSPEAFEPLSEALFQLGAKDVFLTPIIMKKSRPATKLSVLARAEDVDALTDRLFTASTTIGVRMQTVTKRMLPRMERTVPTSLGSVRVKIVTLPNGARRWKVEHDDIGALARHASNDYLSVKAQIEREVTALIEQELTETKTAEQETIKKGTIKKETSA